MENEKERAKRPRLGQIIKDELMFDGVAFMQNKSSQNARKSHTIENKLHFDMWMDKHYQIRYQHGDEFGKREGIDPDRVLALVEKSLKHLIIYSTHVRGFSFTKIDGSAIDPQKTVLQEEIDGMVLNVVIKAHLIDIHTFEITIITAMCVDDFRIFDGQYVIDIHGNTSTLLRKESKKML